MAVITSTAQLVQSTQSRTGTPDGNIYFNPDGSLEVITEEELAQVDLGSGLVANPLTNADGISMQMIYTFERQERRTDENLRELDVFVEGSFKFAGAYNFVNGRKLSTAGVVAPLTDDRQKIRGSGFIENAVGGAIDRIYFGVRSLGTILNTSQPYVQLIQNSATTDFTFQGGVNEVVQVFGSTANGDLGAGDFDNRTFLAASVRTWGQVHDRKFLTDSGISEMSGYSGALGLGERPNTYHQNYNQTDVFGGGSIAPWSTMSFETLDAADTLTGLVNTGTSNPESGTFSARINNPNNGTLSQLVAFMDALAIENADIDSHPTNTRNGRENETLYTLDAAGNVVLRQGIYLQNVPVADRQLIRYTDDDGDALIYETVVGGNIDVGQAAAADGNAWYHMFYADPPGVNDEFNTLNAVTVNDAAGAPIKGNVAGRTLIPWDFARSTNTQAGFAADTDRDVVIEVEGDGIATFAKTLHTIGDSVTQSIVCQPPAESNI